MKTHDGASGAPWPSPSPAPLPSRSAWSGTQPPAAAPATNALTLQLKATDIFRESYMKPGSDEDSGGETDEDDVDYWPDPGVEKFQLLRRIFVENGELRRYFEENYKAGEFFCFVCGGIGKKGSGKTFKSCQGLLQHASAMSKVERNQSHRAFGLVVSKVLGWDFDQIPGVVLKGEPLGRTLGGGNAGLEKLDFVEVPSGSGAKLVGIEGSAGKGASVGDVVTDNVVCANGNGGETAEIKGFDGNRQTDVEKGNVECTDIVRGLDIGTSEVKGNIKNEATIQPCSKGIEGSTKKIEEENASEDGDNHDTDDEEEDPSENGNEDEEEDPSENGSEDEEEDPSENGNEVEEEEEGEDPSENGDVEEKEDPSEDGEEEEEDPSEDGSGEEGEEDLSEEDSVENDNKDENKGSESSTVSKSCSLDKSLAQLADDAQGLNQLKISTSEWVEAVVTAPSAEAGWPVITPKSASAASSLSAEQQAMLAADQLQRKAVKLCKEFFRTSSTLDRNDSDHKCDDKEEKEVDDEEDSSEDSGSEKEDADLSDDSKELNFFLKLFSEDVKLREFYTNDHGSRGFCCLVCGGIGKKEWKRFTSVALVQHSTAISKTRKKRAHRAYGQIICRVLGLDVNRLPSIVIGSESLDKDQQPWLKPNAVQSIEGTVSAAIM